MSRRQGKGRNRRGIGAIWRNRKPSRLLGSSLAINTPAAGYLACWQSPQVFFPKTQVAGETSWAEALAPQCHSLM
jgi:hypothetical protein